MRAKAERDGEEGFLEYLEDLIGTNQYLPEIRSNTEDMENLRETRLNTLEKFQKLTKERDALEELKKEAFAFLQKDIQLQKTVSIMCQLKILAVEDEI